MDNSQKPPHEDEQLLEAPAEEPLLEAPEEEKLLPAHSSRGKGTLVKILLGIVGALTLAAIAFTAYTLLSGVATVNPEINAPAPSPTETVTQDLTRPPSMDEEGVQTACTMEAKLCPDGSSVGRTRPNCEFAACPGE